MGPPLSNGSRDHGPSDHRQDARAAAKKSAAPIFIWEAKTKQGEVKKGEMEAGDPKAVEARLLSLGMTPTKVRKKGMLDMNLALPGSIVSKDILIFTRQFATMIDAGLPLVQCLEILGSQTENPAFRKVIFAIKTRVEGGSTFSDALKDHPKVFDELYVQLCAAGEVGGILDTILNRLAIYSEKSEKLARKVKGALTYPIIVVTIGFVITAVLLVKVFPSSRRCSTTSGPRCRPPPRSSSISPTSCRRTSSTCWSASRLRSSPSARSTRTPRAARSSTRASSTPRWSVT